MAFKFNPLNIPDVLLIETDKFSDERGFFMESYKQSEFAKLGLPEFSQDNLSYSKRGVLRGLHYQLPPFGQAKLVRVMKGKIWDVAVDLRPSSANFKKWVAVELDDQLSQAFYIPEGFAHGFVVLSDDAIVSYKASNSYNKQAERGIVWNSKILNINWPVQNPLLSEKDLQYPDLDLTQVFN